LAFDPILIIIIKSRCLYCCRSSSSSLDDDDGLRLMTIIIIMIQCFVCVCEREGESIGDREGKDQRELERSRTSARSEAMMAFLLLAAACLESSSTRSRSS